MNAKFYLGQLTISGDYQLEDKGTDSTPRVERSFDISRIEVNGTNISDEIEQINNYALENKCSIFEAIEKICLKIY